MTRTLVAMITDDFQPLSVIEDTGFRRFVSLLDPQYSIPNRKKLRLMMEDDYHKQKEAVNLAMEHSTCVSLTTDIWTSLNSEAYIAVTGHLINTNWCLKALALETFHFPEKHTALNISEVLDNMISKWNIGNKVVSITTDNASNMTAAVQLIHSGNIYMQHVPCLAHTINLVVKSSLNTNSELCIMWEKAREIVSYFKTCCNANEKLHEIQDLMKKPVHKLIQETETQWNKNLTADEWRILKECLCVLESFEVVTSEISTENYTSLSKAIPIIIQLILTICNGKWATMAAQELEHHLHNSLISRLRLIETNKVHAVATGLDPRF
ncbi:E3 SUMO-protein ligase ZBED1-like [Schistocerca nitens]|uniref:E3 SUMO-protein ligase ZBED1-like n=1 Tax=Schistocerca nitens TaxID=7011 RepID=UPI00211939DA|nr:E3 SUMO-protein ligase ZBED1-like [Schistocerca nitens]